MSIDPASSINSVINPKGLGLDRSFVHVPQCQNWLINWGGESTLGASHLGSSSCTVSIIIGRGLAMFSPAINCRFSLFDPCSQSRFSTRKKNRSDACQDASEPRSPSGSCRGSLSLRLCCPPDSEYLDTSS